MPELSFIVSGVIEFPVVNYFEASWVYTVVDLREAVKPLPVITISALLHQRLKVNYCYKGVYIKYMSYSCWLSYRCT